MPIKLIIIDDEKDSLDALEIIISESFNNIEIIGKYSNPIEGRQKVMELNPDILMLDINMPKLSGIELAESLKREKKFELIFVTAYNQYALDAFKANAIDYVLKPYNFCDVVNAIEKAINRIVEKNQKCVFNKISIATTKGHEVFDPTEIISIVGEGAYSVIVTKNKRFTVSRNMSDIEELLCNSTFFRCHKSYIVNLQHVVRFDKSFQVIVMSNDEEIPLSVRKKDELLNVFKRI
jgi:two-component system LytT family response regulator